MDDLISIIVPVYKVENYLRKCVDSIINQTYKNLEIILVDDGSPDNCPKICDEYAKQDSRIKVIHKENGGLSSARNAGLDIAKGDYIGFIDSDDYIDKNMYLNLYKNIKHANADVSIVSIQNIDEFGNNLKNYSPNLPNKVLNRKQVLECLFFEGYVYYVVAWNKLYKSSLFKDIRYPNGSIHEDEAIIHDIFLKCEKIVTSSDRCYYYLQRESSIMHTSKDVRKTIKHFYLADRLCKTYRLIDYPYIKFGLDFYFWNFFDNYYSFDDKYYLNTMRKSLIKVYPIMIKYKYCSIKEMISFSIFIVTPNVYKRFFYK